MGRELHQKGHGALFLNDGFGKGRERGHCSLADNDEKPEGHHEVLSTGISKRKETVDLANQRLVERALPEHQGGYRESGGIKAKAKI